MTTILFSTHPEGDLEAQLHRLRNLPSLPPFSPQARAFAAEFASRLKQLPQLRQFPELATLAHWFRPAALDRLERRLETGESDLLLPRGLVFHLAPANVDVLFAYAWLISVLCGNRNACRLSQKPAAQRDALIGVLGQLHDEGAHREILERTLLLTYPHDDSVTSRISMQCHARIIWGGDATVAKIRSIPLAPLAIEMAFPDRFGVAVFKAGAIAAVPPDALPGLARRFCNDVLWFGQQACSSPRCLYWVGSAVEIAAAKASFWPAVRDQAGDFGDEPAALMSRITDACLLAALGEEVTRGSAIAEYPMRMTAVTAGGEVRELQSGHGMIVEVDLPSLEALVGQLDDRDQTLVQHGFSVEEFGSLLGKLGSRAIDRVVPVGRALDFHPVWDGMDLFRVLTRQTTIAAA